MAWTAVKTDDDFRTSANWNSLTSFLGSGRHGLLPFYVIRKSGDVYYAREGHTGGRYSDYDAGFLVNRLVNMQTSGAEIFFRAGTYGVGTQIVLQDKTRLSGEGFSSVLQAEDGFSKDMFAGGASANLDSVQVSHLQFNGDGNGGSCFNIGCKYGLFHHLLIKDFAENGFVNAAPESAGATLIDGIWIDGCTGYGVKLDFRSYDWFIIDTFIKDCGSGGFYFNGAAGTILKNFNVQGGGVSDNGVYCNETGKLTFSDFIIEDVGQDVIYVYSDSERRSRLTINDGKVLDSGLDVDATYYGVNIQGSAGYPYKYCNVHDLMFDSSDTAKQPLYVVNLERNQYTRVSRMCASNESFDASGGIIQETSNTKTRLFDHKWTHVPIDLTGGAVTVPVINFEERRSWLSKAQLVYTVDTTGSTNVGLELGKESDSAFYWSKTLTASDNKTAYNITNLPLSNQIIAAGDTVTFGKDANVATTGKVAVNLQVLVYGGGSD